MRPLLFLLLLSAGLAAGSSARLPALPASLADFDKKTDPDIYDAEIGGGLSGGSEVTINGFSPGEIGVTDFNFSTGVTLPAGDEWIVRYGLLFRNKAFQGSGRVPMLEGKGVHALAFDVRATREIGDNLTLLAGVMPGSYGQKYEFSSDFGVPALLTLGYRLGDSVVIVGGARYNPKSPDEILPVGGLRWSPSARFRAMLLFPRTTLEYDWTETTTVFLTANLQDAVYRINDARLANLDEKLDRVRGRLRELFPNANLPPILADDDYDFPSLVNTQMLYNDLRVGVGLAWNLGDGWKLDLEGGISAERSLEFAAGELDVNSDGQPYYVRGGFTTSF